MASVPVIYGEEGDSGPVVFSPVGGARDVSDSWDSIFIIIPVNPLVRVRPERLDHPMLLFSISGLLEVNKGVVVGFWINEILLHFLPTILLTLGTHHLFRHFWRRLRDIKHIKLSFHWLHLDISQRPSTVASFLDQGGNAVFADFPLFWFDSVTQ